jgi:hypothetical protein
MSNPEVVDAIRLDDIGHLRRKTNKWLDKPVLFY